MELCASATVHDCGTAVEFISQVISLIFGVIVVEALSSTPKLIWYKWHLFSLSYVVCCNGTKYLVVQAPLCMVAAQL